MSNTDSRRPQGAREQRLGTNTNELETNLHQDDQYHRSMGRGGGMERSGEVEESTKENTVPELEVVFGSTIRDTSSGGR